MLFIWQGWDVATFGRVCGAEVVGSNLINRPFANLIFLNYIFYL